MMDTLYPFLAILILFGFWFLSLIKLFTKEGGVPYFLKHFLSASLICGGLFIFLIFKGSDLEGMGNLIIFTPLLAFVYVVWAIILFFKTFSFNKEKEGNDDILDKA